MTLNLDTINLLIAVAGVANIAYGFVVWERGKAQETNRAFFLFAITVTMWAVAMIFFRSATNEDTAVLVARFLYIAAAVIPLAFVHFAFVFETPSYSYSSTKSALIAIPGAITVAIAAIPNALIAGVEFTPGHEPIIIFNLFFHLLYFLYVAVYALAVLIVLLIRFSHSTGIVRNRIAYILLGTSLPWAVAITTNVVLPLFGVFTYNWLGQVSTFFSTTVISYGIFRSRLFDVRVITTELLALVLSFISFVQILLSANEKQTFFEAGIFILLLVISYILIRSVHREVEQRELIEKQERELEAVNKQQESLLHFISHEIKGYLTKNEAMFASIIQGDFGQVSPELLNMSGMALADVRKGVRTVLDILDASNLKKGTVSFSKTVFDMKDTVESMVEHLKPAADEKRLKIETSMAWELPCKVSGDEAKVRDHVVRNLIDNAIKYTPAGSIKVEVLRAGDVVRFSVRDSGVGITDEDKKRLFTEGGHGKDSIKINVHSTGYGLFIAKQVVDAHGGKIWAESDGPGKGSRFVVELPAA
jgi:signal transduction histidine kinase